ncbi:hypothetical protein VTN02DRAFT_3264 [Thermoascus thermophilus]
MRSPPDLAPLRLLVCPSGFKESLEAHAAADCIEEGILRVLPNALVRKVPLVDGGEGFARALVAATGGELRQQTVTGPVRALIPSHYGILGGSGHGGLPLLKTAVIEMAAAAGLRLVSRDCRNPCLTTTFGVGQLIAAALDEGVDRIIVGCGDSGTSDGGAGMLQALGARLLDREGNELPRASGGEALAKLADIDLSGLHPRLTRRDVRIEAACNWQNVLAGPDGVAHVYGPQKGATPEQTALLAAALDVYASVARRKLGFDVSRAPGSGASGGLGTGLLLLGAVLRPRYEAISEYLDLDGLFQDCDLVVTAEGAIDFQTPRGKIPAEVAMRAKKHRLPVIALAGTIGPGADANYKVGIDAYVCMLQRPTTLEEAIREAERLLTDSAECAMRMVMVGRTLGAAPVVTGTLEV